MNLTARKKMALLATLPMLFATIAYALTTYTYSFQNNANVSHQTSAQILINNVAWTNGTAIEWNNVTRGSTYQKNMTVINTGTTPIDVSAYTIGLENGWIQKWNTTQTIIQPNQSLSAPLTLTIPQNATAGEHTWTYHVVVRG